MFLLEIRNTVNVLCILWKLLYGSNDNFYDLIYNL